MGGWVVEKKTIHQNPSSAPLKLQNHRRKDFWAVCRKNANDFSEVRFFFFLTSRIFGQRLTIAKNFLFN